MEKEANVENVEISEGMIEAGLSAFAGFNRDFESPEFMLRRVYLAMASAGTRRSEPPRPVDGTHASIPCRNGRLDVTLSLNIVLAEPFPAGDLLSRPKQNS